MTTDSNDIETLQRHQMAELQAKLDVAQRANTTNSGAVAQKNDDALGKGSVKINDSNSGSINTGTQIIYNYHAATSTSLSKEQIAQRVSAYLKWLQDRTKCIELRGIELAGGAPVVMLPLETAYVPLRARSISWVGVPPGMHEDREQRQDVVSREQEADVALNQVLGLSNRLVIIGGPGSGKTTVLLHMAWALASSLLMNQSEPACSRLGLSIEPSELPLPIFVPLASFARYRRNLPSNAAAQKQTLRYFISYHLISKQANFDLPKDFFEQLLENGRDVLLLLDGMDEVANEDERAEVRQSIEELVSGRQDMRVAVTCRAVAYRSGRTALAADFHQIAVQPLDPDQHITPMVTQAYNCIYPSDTMLRNERINDLLSGIQRLEAERRLRLGDEVEALVDSPLMVRLLLIVHLNNRTLPDERAGLFDKAINALLQVDYGREESDIRELSTDWKLYRDMAQHLALHMHQQGRDQGREIEEPALKGALREEPEFIPHIEAFLCHARQRGSVLEEHEGGYRFIHLAFQEFLVARYLREVIGGEGREQILTFLSDRLDDPWWREPILLLVGYWAINAAKAARNFLAALVRAGSTSNAQFSAAEIAASATLEWRESGTDARVDCSQQILALLNNKQVVMQSKPVLRARAGDALARLGDLRFDPQRHHLPIDDLLGFVPIAADPAFCIGTRKADAQRVAEIGGYTIFDNEINDERSPTSAFYIARYAVTVAQFNAFVTATRFKVGDDAALRDPGSRPVHSVNWHEALKYCDWLNHELCHSPLFEQSELTRLVRDEGWRITLPSELEWEKAARGGKHATLFPWGDQADPNKANYGDTKIGATSAVGCFAANGFGLYDMSGNLFEWTRSLWRTDRGNPEFAYPYNPNDLERENLEAGDDAMRVVRGGAWFGRQDLARCAWRCWFRPGLRYLNVGFRLVLRSPPV